MENNKYLLAIMIAKRAKELKAGAKPLVESKHKRFIMIALEEIKAGKVYLKEEEEPIKAEEIFNEDERPAKVEELSDEAKKPEKPEELSDEVEEPAEIEETFKKDEEFGKSKGLLND